MIVGIFADPHITKNMRSMQDVWEKSVTDSIINMYKTFDKEGVNFAVCLGDFFHAPILEAKSLHFVLPILNYINSRDYPTFFLLGNHEVDDSEHNILGYLSEYENIKPVVDSDIYMDNFAFIPYTVDPEELDDYFMKDKYVFTHHDIYGSELASGKTKAFFGFPPALFKDAKKVFNGHVHLKSQVSENIINVGSLTVSQQGELKLGEYPEYLILNSSTGELSTYKNEYSMIYLSIDESETKDIVSSGYEASKLVLRVDYEGEIPENYIGTLHTSWRKKISSIENSEVEVVKSSNFDMKNYIVEYLKNDDSIPAESKEDYTNTALELLN